MLPRLHLVTDDAVLAEPAFLDRAQAALVAGGALVALHVRGHATAAAALHRAAERLAVAALRAGSWLLVNDRIDLAMAVRAHGVQLGLRSLPVTAARMLLGAGARIGYSAHTTPEAAEAAMDGADFVLLGTIYATTTHAAGVPVGTTALRECVERADIPVIGIGGITPERVPQIARAGAHGVAVLGGVWRSGDAARAVSVYVDAVRKAWP